MEIFKKWIEHAKSFTCAKSGICSGKSWKAFFVLSFSFCVRVCVFCCYNTQNGKVQDAQEPNEPKEPLVLRPLWQQNSVKLFKESVSITQQAWQPHSFCPEFSAIKKVFLACMTLCVCVRAFMQRNTFSNELRPWRQNTYECVVAGVPVRLPHVFHFSVFTLFWIPIEQGLNCRYKRCSK